MNNVDVLNTDKLLRDIKQCSLCSEALPLPPRPILQASEQSKILIAGQAPGAVTHEKYRPFDDKSGERLRQWLAIDEATFYSQDHIALMPMGFCYPGKGKSGDLPPIKACAQTWRKPLLSTLKHIELTILLGQYAINWHLAQPEYSNLKLKFSNITELVKQYERLLDANLIALPHPSPRNNIWLKKNPWFDEDVLPLLKHRVTSILNTA